MKTGVLVLLVAFLDVAQSKSLSDNDLIKRLLGNLIEKRAYLLLPELNSEVACTFDDGNSYYKPGDDIGVLGECYRCTVDSHCHVQCQYSRTQAEHCSTSKPKQCKYMGDYYPIGQEVSILLDPPLPPNSPCKTKFAEDCYILFENCEEWIKQYYGLSK